MQTALIMLMSFVAYAAGLVLMIKMAPRLLVHSFDEIEFMGIASAEIFGALLVFGAVVVMLALSNGAVVIKVIDACLLIGMIVAMARMALHSFRASGKTFQATRLLASGFFLCLLVAAAYCVLQLFG